MVRSPQTIFAATYLLPIRKHPIVSIYFELLHDSPTVNLPMGNVYLLLIWLVHCISATASSNANTNITTFSLNVCNENNNIPQSKYVEFSIPKDLLSTRFSNHSFHFQFRNIGNDPSCINGSRKITWRKSKNKVESEVTILISPNGYLKYNDRIYEKDQYCLKDFDENEWQFKVCNDECSPQTPCILKCCDPDEVFDASKFPALKCQPSGLKQWKPILYSDVSTKLKESQLKAITPITIHHDPRKWLKQAKCNPVTLSRRHIDDDMKEANLFNILKDGTIWRCLGKGNWVPFETQNICIDGIQNFTNGPTYFSGDEDDVLILKCTDSDSEKQESHQRQQSIDRVYIVFLIISSIVLLITLVVHLLVWEKHTVNIWTQVIYIGCLFANYVCLSAIHISSLDMVRAPQPKLDCKIIAVLAHFFFISTFSWLSVINYDIYNTFRALKPTSGKSKGLKKLIFYAMFGFGVPVTIVTIALTLESIYGNEGSCVRSVITPEYGVVTCYLGLEYAQLPYVYIPIGTLLTANLIFFTLTVYSLYSIQKSTKFATRSSSKAEKQNQSVVLFAKLFLLMGLPWCFEVISWATTKDYDSVKWYWVVTDVLLICQSFSIFSIFVMKKEMCRALDSKFPRFKKFKESLTLSEEKNQLLSRDYPFFIRCARWLHCPCFPSENQDSVTSKSTSVPSTSSNHNPAAIKSTSPKTHVGNEEIEMK